MAKQSTEYKAEYARNHYARIEFTILASTADTSTAIRSELAHF